MTCADPFAQPLDDVFKRLDEAAFYPSDAVHIPEYRQILLFDTVRTELKQIEATLMLEPKGVWAVFYTYDCFGMHVGLREAFDTRQKAMDYAASEAAKQKYGQVFEFASEAEADDFYSDRELIGVFVVHPLDVK